MLLMLNNDVKVSKEENTRASMDCVKNKKNIIIQHDCLEIVLKFLKLPKDYNFVF